MKSFLTSAKNVILTEAKEIAKLESKLDNNFNRACNLIKKCSGKVVLMGMGKSGHIARKIAATLASTGTSSFFVHPAEAGHGDLGMISTKDIVIAISYSGSNDEILALIPTIKRLGVYLITMTGNKSSSMATLANVHLDVAVDKEACPHNLAPTSSTTVALVMGDAIAISLLEDKGFSGNDFAKTHPLGALGRRLILSVADIMQTKNAAPLINTNIKLIQALTIMSEKLMGFIIIIDKNSNLLGVFTDGDLRRLLQKEVNISKLNIHDVMIKKCHCISKDKLATSALEMMDKMKINALPVRYKNKIIGAINMHTLLNAKII